MHQRLDVRTPLKHICAVVLMMAVSMLTAYPQAYAKEKIFYVPINRSELITTPSDMGEVIITDPEVADVYVHGKNKVSVIGKNIGTTTLRIFSPSNQLLRNMDVVVTYDLPAIRKALRDFLPSERIGVELVNTRIALTGEVTSAQSAATALEIAEQFVLGKLTNDQVTAREVITSDAGKKASPILNLMKIGAGQQVMLRIRIGEIKRSAVKNLGVDVQAVKGGDLPINIATGGGIGRALGTFSLPDDVRGAASIAGELGSFGLAGALNLLEENGLFKILAEPNLTAISGEQAEFLAGSEFPVPVNGGPNGGISIIFRPVGVSLKFTPHVLSENRIRIQVNPEVSEIGGREEITNTFGNTVTFIINTRRAATTVELAPGESFMIAGLLSDNITSQISQIPGVGDIPIIGALSRSTAFQRNETELVIAVTPYLIDPMKSGDVKLPTDNFRPASTMEMMFYGALGKVFGSASQTPSMEGPVGFITD